MYTMVDIDQPLFYRVLIAQSGIGLGVCRPPMEWNTKNLAHWPIYDPTVWGIPVDQLS